MTKAIRRFLIDRDRLMSSSSQATASDTVDVFDRIQQKPKERQLLALACAFTLLCDACNIPPQDVFLASANLMADKETASGLRPQFRAMQYHLETEVLG